MIRQLEIRNRGEAGKQHLEKEALGDPVRKIVVTTGEKNEPAKRFYEKHGFIQVGRIRIDERLQLARFEKNLVETDGGRYP